VSLVEKDLDKHVATHMKSQEVTEMLEEGRRLQCLTLTDLRAKHGEVLTDEYIEGAFGPHIEHLVRIKRSHGALVTTGNTRPAVGWDSVEPSVLHPGPVQAHPGSNCH